MNSKSYQILAMKTNDHRSSQRLMEFSFKPNQRYDMAQLFNATLGLSGEVGEFNDAIKKMIFHEQGFNEEHLKKELGDILWYVALICDTFEWEMGDIMRRNIDKLVKRYPEGFSTEKSNNRKEDDI